MPGEVSALDLGAVAEIFGHDWEVAPDWYDFSVCGPRPGGSRTRGGLQLVVDRGMEALATADTIVVLPVARYARQRPEDELLEPLADAAPSTVSSARRPAPLRTHGWSSSKSASPPGCWKPPASPSPRSPHEPGSTTSPCSGGTSGPGSA